MKNLRSRTIGYVSNSGTADARGIFKDSLSSFFARKRETDGQQAMREVIYLPLRRMRESLATFEAEEVRCRQRLDEKRPGVMDLVKLYVEIFVAIYKIVEQKGRREAFVKKERPRRVYAGFQVKVDEMENLGIEHHRQKRNRIASTFRRVALNIEEFVDSLRSKQNRQFWESVLGKLRETQSLFDRTYGHEELEADELIEMDRRLKDACRNKLFAIVQQILIAVDKSLGSGVDKPSPGTLRRLAGGDGSYLWRVNAALESYVEVYGILVDLEKVIGRIKVLRESEAGLREKNEDLLNRVRDARAVINRYIEHVGEDEVEGAIRTLGRLQKEEIDLETRRQTVTELLDISHVVLGESVGYTPEAIAAITALAEVKRFLDQETARGIEEEIAEFHRKAAWQSSNRELVGAGV